MTIAGALSELNNLLKADDIPFYYKPAIRAVMDTIALSGGDLHSVTPQEPKAGNLISKDKVIDILDYWYDTDSDGYVQARKSIYLMEGNE